MGLYFFKKEEEEGIVLDQIILVHGLVGRVQIPGFISNFFFFWDFGSFDPSECSDRRLP
jgi:hypothetical protein